ncbi:Quinate permease [Colletotrichum sidae]|uniref:Quinate permease n=1 Tax=Colletotrichum sidae TaxID=1347389 RepID=A0A4R8TSN9_9PEZI|nr:Quinate permease [Colletotrichum sidae]
MGLLQKIVRNEATRSDPPEIYNARVVLISSVACDGALLFGMDMGIIGGVLTMDSFKRQVLTSGTQLQDSLLTRTSARHYGLMDQPKTALANLESNIVSVIQAGAFAGALFSTWLANRVGRRFSLIIASILVFIGVALQAAASGYIEAILIAGIAIGIASSVNPLYVSENAPRGIRGLLTGLYQLSIRPDSFPAAILFVGMLIANESPRFLAQRNPDKALAVLARLRNLPADHQYVVQEMEGISRQLEEERALSVNASGFTLLEEAFTVKSYRRRSESVSAPGYVALVAIYIFAAVYHFGWGPVVWTYSSEIPPARLRALMMGMATASQWLFNFVVAKATPSIFCFVMVVFAWFFVPETSGIALEQMDALFEQNSLKDRLVFTKGPRLSSRESADDEIIDKKDAEHVEVA